jgi:hypothetical protein
MTYQTPRRHSAYLAGLGVRALRAFLGGRVRVRWMPCAYDSIVVLVRKGLGRNSIVLTAARAALAAAFSLFLYV